jgi:nuclear protein localization protein 4 homolog
MLLRVRSNVGQWRVDGLADDATATVQDVLAKIHTTRPQVVYFAPDVLMDATSSSSSSQEPLDVSAASPFSLDPAGKQLVDFTLPLSQQGLRHGSMIYCRVDPTTCVDISSSLSSSSAAVAAAAAKGSSAEGGGGATAIKPWQQPEASSTASHMRRVIDKDGTVRLVPLTSDDLAKNALTGYRDKGFRPGMLALRDMKMSWTLNDFMALDSQFQFKIQRQPTAICTQCSFDMASIASFQQYAQRFSFARKRIGYLYGKFVEPTAPTDSNKEEEDAKKKQSSDSSWMNVDNSDEKKKKQLTATKVVVETIYEPPQQVDATAAEGFVLLDDEREAVVEEIARLLGLTKVGWIIAHEAREAGYVLSAAEVIMAAELQLEAAGGVEPTPFVTVTVAVRPPPSTATSSTNDGTDAGVVSVEAFQVSQQCMAMVAEEALLVSGLDGPKVCRVSDTFTAIQEGKESKTVENSFFITLVPIAQHNSELLVADFPKLNRDLDDRTPSHNELKRSLQKASTTGGGGSTSGGGGGGWTFVDRLADFNLLIYLAQFLDVSADFPKICAAIVNRDKVALDDGYKILIKSMAGMDGSY